MLWASFAAGLGYIGGHTFHEQTLLATGLGMVLAIGFAATVEVVLSRRERRAAGAADSAGAGVSHTGDLAA